MSFSTRTILTWSIKCDAGWPASPRGCAGSGRPFGGIDEAEEWAIKMGWQIEGAKAFCPAHVESRTGKIEGK